MVPGGDATMVDRVGQRLGNYHHNLPAQSTPLIGRKQEVAAAWSVGAFWPGTPRQNLVGPRRAVLHLGGEHDFPAPPLALPDLTHLPGSESLLQYAAVALFLHCAQATKPDFQVTPASTRTI